MRQTNTKGGKPYERNDDFPHDYDTLREDRHQLVRGGGSEEAGGSVQGGVWGVLLTRIFEKAQRFFEIPEFKYYAMVDGIYWILAGARSGLFPKRMVTKETGQLTSPL